MSDEIDDIRLCVQDAEMGGFLETLADVRSDRATLMKEVDRLRARVAELEKTLAEANEEAISTANAPKSGSSSSNRQPTDSRSSG